MPKLVAPLSNVGYQNVALVGGKAASLGELINARLPVPPGFVITTTAYRQGLTAQLEAEILAAFDALGHERVAVRSSAVAEDSEDASWAGQLETKLNVRRPQLLEAVQACWQSGSSAHALRYAANHQLAPSQHAIAVVLQAMVNADVAGVMFTANPVTGSRQEVVIEAVHGLGELLVQGTVTPDSWFINKASGRVISYSPGQQSMMLTYREGHNQEVPVPPERQDARTLSADQLQDLLTLANRIEQHYGRPQDVEWALSGSQIFVVQARPITTLSESN